MHPNQKCSIGALSPGVKHRMSPGQGNSRIAAPAQPEWNWGGWRAAEPHPLPLWQQGGIAAPSAPSAPKGSPADN